jgi:hypothetical protein
LDQRICTPPVEAERADNLREVMWVSRCVKSDWAVASRVDRKSSFDLARAFLAGLERFDGDTGALLGEEI